ncbi:MAG: hypothetical protein EBY40_04215 [Marivivens sp.]|nr:hypothetical protein [Marivivens sp.]NDH02317.1 hypothetical protein [Marivivens sp.]
MPARDIYFLFNNEDGSYNSHSNEPHPAFMKKGNITERLLSVDIKLFSDITLTFYDEVSSKLVDASSFIQKLDGTEAGMEAIEKLLAEALEDPTVELDATGEKIAQRNLLIDLAKRFLPADRVQTIIADGRIDVTEASEIKAAIEASRT